MNHDSYSNDRSNKRLVLSMLFFNFVNYYIPCATLLFFHFTKKKSWERLATHVFCFDLFWIYGFASKFCARSFSINFIIILSNICFKKYKKLITGWITYYCVKGEPSQQRYVYCLQYNILTFYFHLTIFWSDLTTFDEQM